MRTSTLDNRTLCVTTKNKTKKTGLPRGKCLNSILRSILYDDVGRAVAISSRSETIGSGHTSVVDVCYLSFFSCIFFFFGISHDRLMQVCVRTCSIAIHRIFIRLCIVIFYSIPFFFYHPSFPDVTIDIIIIIITTTTSRKLPTRVRRDLYNTSLIHIIL